VRKNEKIVISDLGIMVGSLTSHFAWDAGFFTGLYCQRGRIGTGFCRAPPSSPQVNKTIEAKMPTSLVAGDVELCHDVRRPLDGYPSLAKDIASDPDRTSLVFRRFDQLAVRNLLYLQSELVELEAMQVRTSSVRSLRDNLLILHPTRNN